MATQGPPIAPAIAFVVSITRPPPSATRLPNSPSSSIKRAAEISSTRPGGTMATVAACSARPGTLSRARSVVSST